MSNDQLLPAITFGMIVLNGEPFIRYNLRALYPFAHQIIVVEGAAPASMNIATSDGHSIDGTLDTLLAFKTRADPENKLTIVTAEDEGHPNGFWTGEKDEQSQAYAYRATGDYLWQVDVDEFYRSEDMQTMLDLLQADPEITAVSFPTVTIWGGFDYVTDGWYLRGGAGIYHRLFRWGPGYRYITHRPPTVHDPVGRDLRSLKWLTGKDTAREGILLYHYSLLFPRQVIEKCAYYGAASWARRQLAERWAREVFLELRRPFQVHNVYDYPAWLERFRGEHPQAIQDLHSDLITGQVDVEMRPTDDIERLLRSRAYRLGRAGLSLLQPFGHKLIPWKTRLSRRLRDPVGSAHWLRHRLTRFLKE